MLNIGQHPIGTFGVPVGGREVAAMHGDQPLTIGTAAVARPHRARRYREAIATVSLACVLMACGGSDNAAPPQSTTSTASIAAGSLSSAPAASTSSTSPAVRPEGFGTIAVRLTKPDGSTCDLCMWLAQTRERRAQGLMRVTDLGGYDGMVFAYDEPSTGGYWMKNTVMPLTIAYVGADGLVVSTADMEPCAPSTAQCPSYPPAGPFLHAIEVPQGELTQLGFVDGVKVAVGGECSRRAG